MDKPNCYITNECARKISYYVGSTELEISGIGKSEFRDGNIFITDVKIYKQKCSAGSTDLDEQDMARVQYQMHKDGELLKDWNVWWHSHAKMGVFWSGTDSNTINEQANNGGYLISLVTNHKGDIKTRLDVFPKDVSPFNIVTYAKAYDDIPTSILPVVNNPERLKEVNAILEAKYKEVDENIKRVEDGTKVIVKEYVDSMEKEKARIVKQIEDDFDSANQELISEYNTLSSSLPEDDDLKATIKAEVDEKVSTRVCEFVTKKYDWWNKDRQVADYDDLDYTYYPKKEKSFDQMMAEIQDDANVALKYVAPMSKKKMKKINKANEQVRREIGFKWDTKK